MSVRRVRAVAGKEFLHVVRDFRSLAMAVAMPIILLLLFGYALTLDVDRVPLVIWDQSQSPASRELISRFEGSRFFSLRGGATRYPQLERAIDSGEALAGLVIPSDFGRRIGVGRLDKVQLIVDGSDANTATLATGYAEGVVRGYSRQVALETMRRLGGRPPEPPLEIRPRVWFNDDLESRNYLLPGLIAVIMMVIAALLTSLTVAREWERGTMEQLIATPLTGGELMLGKLLPYFGIGLFDVLLAVLMGEFLFEVPLRGSVLLLFTMSALFLSGALAMGLLISIATRNQMLANQLALVTTFVPSFLLSGLMFSIANMPQPIQWVTYLIPARYFVALLRGIYLKGVGLEVLAAEAGLLAMFAAAMVVLANAAFKKKIR